MKALLMEQGYNVSPDLNFCSSINHEVRNSMNAIMGFAQILNYDSISNEERKEYAQIIFKESKFLLQYFNQMMNVFQSISSIS